MRELFGGPPPPPAARYRRDFNATKPWSERDDAAVLSVKFDGRRPGERRAEMLRLAERLGRTHAAVMRRRWLLKRGLAPVQERK